MGSLEPNHFKVLIVFLSKFILKCLLTRSTSKYFLEIILGGHLVFLLTVAPHLQWLNFQNEIAEGDLLGTALAQFSIFALSAKPIVGPAAVAACKAGRRACMFISLRGSRTLINEGQEELFKSLSETFVRVVFRFETFIDSRHRARLGTTIHAHTLHYIPKLQLPDGRCLPTLYLQLPNGL